MDLWIRSIGGTKERQNKGGHKMCQFHSGVITYKHGSVVTDLDEDSHSIGKQQSHSIGKQRGHIVGKKHGHSIGKQQSHSMGKQHGPSG